MNIISENFPIKEVAICWLRQAEIEAACKGMQDGDAKEFVPYFIEQLEDCFGRSGRGRLWTAKKIFGAVDCSASFDAKPAIAKELSERTGIVFLLNDLKKIYSTFLHCGCPTIGIVTDLHLKQIEIPAPPNPTTQKTAEDHYLEMKNNAILDLDQARKAKEPDPRLIAVAAMNACRTELEYVAHCINTNKEQVATGDEIPNLISIMSCCGDLFGDEGRKIAFWEMVFLVAAKQVADVKGEKTQPTIGALVKIPVAQLEYREGQNTIWVQSPRGATVLRIQTKPGKRITSTICRDNPVSHSDINVPEDIEICLSDDAEVEPT